MKIKAIENVTCEATDYRLSVACEAEGFRYHVWLTQDLEPQDGIVYKNLPRNPDGSWPTSRTQYLRTTGGGMGAQVWALMKPRVPALIDAARVKHAERKAADEAARKESARIGRIIEGCSNVPDDLVRFLGRIIDESSNLNHVNQAQDLLLKIAPSLEDRPA